MDTGITHADGQSAPRGTRPTARAARGTQRLRGRGVRLFLALSVAVVSCGLATAGATVTAGPAAATPAPTCVFSGKGLGAIGPLIGPIKAGSVVDINCKNLTASHPYLLAEASLLVAIDPAAKPLLQGQATSVPGLLAIIAALPELNLQSLAYPQSNSKGQLVNYAYTVPSSQPLDPNATCPPTTQQFNSGLIGCAVAMIDLTTFKPVVPGTFVLNYATQPLFPPNPTAAFSPTMTHPGQTVTVHDAVGAKSYWWLATLVSLYANLAGGSETTTSIPLVVRMNGHKVKNSTVGVAPATYNGVTFTPPVLSGHFTAVRGRSVKLDLSANLLGLPIDLFVKAKLVSKK
jgi:hypothetical protein